MVNILYLGKLVVFFPQNRYIVYVEVYPFSTSTLNSLLSKTPPQYFLHCRGGFVFLQSVPASFLVFHHSLTYFLSVYPPCCVVLSGCYPLPLQGVALSTQLPFSITWLHQPGGSLLSLLGYWLCSGLLSLLLAVFFLSSFLFLLDCFLLPQPEGLPPAKTSNPSPPPNIRFFSKSDNFLRTHDVSFSPQRQKGKWLNIFYVYLGNIFLEGSLWIHIL